MNGFRLILFSAFMTLCNAISPVFSQITAPRAWAEWEETDGIIIHQPDFYLQQDPSPVELMIAEEWDSLYLDLIRGLFAEGVKIYYILDTNDRPEYHSGILDTMNLKYGIDIHHPDFHIVFGCKQNYSNLTKWTRDHGPMNVYKNGADSLYFYLFRDDAWGAGGVLRDYLGMPDTVFYNASSGNTASDGGNYIVDGNSMGIINGGPGAVLPLLKDYFGLDTVYSLPDYLDHADYYVKMLNEEILIISSQDEENYTYGTEPYTYEQDSAILEGMVTFFQEQATSQFGRPMKVFKVTNPPSMRDDSLQLWWYTQYASYTNALMANRSLFVPQFGVKASDSTALAIYTQAMPGYTIIPVFARRGAAAGGGVHCLTNSVAAQEPVFIRHCWYRDTVAPAAGYEIVADIQTRTGIKNAYVFWSTLPEGPFQSDLMQNISDDVYSVTIPRQDNVTGIYYYITAESNSGKTGRKPMTAPGHTYHISVQGGAPGWISQPKLIQGKLKVFPNPASVQVTVDWSAVRWSANTTIILYLYDMLGQEISRQALSAVENAITLDVSSIHPGQYFLVLMGEQGEFIYEKLVIGPGR